MAWGITEERAHITVDRGERKERNQGQRWTCASHTLSSLSNSLYLIKSQLLEFQPLTRVACPGSSRFQNPALGVT